MDGMIKKNILSPMKRLEKAEEKQEKKNNGGPKRRPITDDSMDKFKTVPKSAEEFARKKWEKMDMMNQEEEKEKGVRKEDAKSGRFPSRRRPSPGGSMDCDTVMRDPLDKMSPQTKHMVCDMYKQWGAGMHKPAEY